MHFSNAGFLNALFPSQKKCVKLVFIFYAFPELVCWRCTPVTLTAEGIEHFSMCQAWYKEFFQH